MEADSASHTRTRRLFTAALAALCMAGGGVTAAAPEAAATTVAAHVAVKKTSTYRGPGLDHPIKGQVLKGQKVGIVQAKGGWKKTTAHHWVKAEHLQTASQVLVAEAKKHVGKPYRTGATGPNAFDCSGLTQYVYKNAVGKSLPRTSAQQRKAGSEVPRSKAKPGDIVWSPGHVAIYMGGTKQIDAPKPGARVSHRNIWQKGPKFLRVVS